MGHGHVHGAKTTPEHALRVALWLNAIFLIVEAVAGWWTNSLALLSDAGHMVSDVGALLIALFALKLSQRSPSADFTFGLKRAPVVAALINGVSLVAIVFFIVLEAVQRFTNPPQMDAPLVILVGTLGLAINLGSAWHLHRSNDHSVNTRGAMLHLLADALGSVAAVVAGIALILWNIPLADPVASLVIAMMILLGSWPLLRETVQILLQKAPDGLDSNKIRHVIETTPTIDGIEDLHLWGLDSGQPILSCILVMDVAELADANLIADEIRQTLVTHFGIEHATLECRSSRTPSNHKHE